jgi:hypothetical protein
MMIHDWERMEYKDPIEEVGFSVERLYPLFSQ